MWCFDILQDCGIERDASVFPASRDFGGFADYPTSGPSWVVNYGMHLKEFPVCTAKLLGKELAYSGGGYFRLFPLWFVRNRMRQNTYNMCYFHIGDLVPEKAQMMSREEYEQYFKEPGTSINRYKRHFKSNIGKGSAFERMITLIQQMDFVSLEQADALIDWEKAEEVRLYEIVGEKNVMDAYDELLQVNIEL